MKEIIDEINKGNIVITPTDTVYGIQGDATNIDAIKKAFEAKQRENKPLLILVSSISMLEKYVSEITDLQREIINKYWPNTLTILFKKNNNLSDELTCGSEFVGVRMPNNKLLLDIMNEIGKPLFSTSANISGEPTIISIDLLNDNLKNHIAYILDDGEKTNISSTLIKVENDKITFLREGELAKNLKEDYNL